MGWGLVVSQRHEHYHNEYRAMFVKNCAVQAQKVDYLCACVYARSGVRDRALYLNQTHVPLVVLNTMFDVQYMPQDGSQGVVSPVQCAKCGATVGVIDEDEVYHLFDVIPNR